MTRDAHQSFARIVRTLARVMQAQSHTHIHAPVALPCAALQVSESAGKEYQIEEAMMDMQQQWESINLNIKPYRDTGTAVLAGVDEVSEPGFQAVSQPAWQPGSLAVSLSGCQAVCARMRVWKSESARAAVRPMVCACACERALST